MHLASFSRPKISGMGRRFSSLLIKPCMRSEAPPKKRALLRTRTACRRVQLASAPAPARPEDRARAHRLRVWGGPSSEFVQLASPHLCPWVGRKFPNQAPMDGGERAGIWRWLRRSHRSEAHQANAAREAAWREKGVPCFYARVKPCCVSQALVIGLGKSSARRCSCPTTLGMSEMLQ